MRTVPVPRPLQRPSTVVRVAPGPGDGWWAGAPSAALTPDGGVALAYRMRFGHDGYDATVLAVSPDGIAFETVAEIPSGAIGAAWVERPTLLRTPGGRWRLYVGRQDPGRPEWYVDAVEADDLADLATAPRRVVLPPDPLVTVKDPVVQVRDGRWHAWLCHHPLDVPGADDRMRTAHAVSDDGWTWRPAGLVLTGREGEWDARGARLTSVLPDGTAFYDGRASRAENWFERSGVARPTADGAFAADPAEPVVDVRYVEVLPLPDGTLRLYYEARTPDGSHELRTEPAG